MLIKPLKFNISYTITYAKLFYIAFFLFQVFFSYIANASNLEKIINDVDSSVHNARKIICTKSGEVNFRNGPGTQFPIIYTILHRGYPMMVLKEADIWYAVRDAFSEVMWIKITNATETCGAIVISDKSAPVFFHMDETSPILFTLEHGYIIDHITCLNTVWCEINVGKHNGWIQKKYIWGNIF